MNIFKNLPSSFFFSFLTHRRMYFVLRKEDWISSIYRLDKSISNPLIIFGFGLTVSKKIFGIQLRIFDCVVQTRNKTGSN